MSAKRLQVIGAVFHLFGAHWQVNGIVTREPVLYLNIPNSQPKNRVADVIHRVSSLNNEVFGYASRPMIQRNDAEV